MILIKEDDKQYRVRYDILNDQKFMADSDYEELKKDVIEAAKHVAFVGTDIGAEVTVSELHEGGRVKIKVELYED